MTEATSGIFTIDQNLIYVTPLDTTYNLKVRTDVEYLWAVVNSAEKHIFGPPTEKYHFGPYTQYLPINSSMLGHKKPLYLAFLDARKHLNKLSIVLETKDSEKLEYEINMTRNALLSLQKVSSSWIKWVFYNIKDPSVEVMSEVPSE